MKEVKNFLIVVGFLTLMNSNVFATIHQISFGDFFFSPEKTVVQPGDTVRWTLASGFHTTTSTIDSPKQWNSGNMSTVGSFFEVAFLLEDGPGPFPYLCGIHPTTMKDTIFMEIPIIECCDLPGDANGDTEVGISDLTYFIDFMFVPGSPPPICTEEFDNNNDCDLGISDLTYFVDFMFVPGSPPPVDCHVCNIN